MKEGTVIGEPSILHRRIAIIMRDICRCYFDCDIEECAMNI